MFTALPVADGGRPGVRTSRGGCRRRRKPARTRVLGLLIAATAAAHQARLATADARDLVGVEGLRLMTSYEIFMLHANRGQPRDDHGVVEGAGLEDLDQDAVGRLLRRVRQREPQPFAGVDDITALVRLGVLRRTEDSWGVTLAGLLTLGQWPQQYLPQLCVTFIAVPAVSKDAVPAAAPRFTDNATVRGPLPQMIEQTVQLILRNTRTAGYVHGLGREDVEDYPVEALREAALPTISVKRESRPHATATSSRCWAMSTCPVPIRSSSTTAEAASPTCWPDCAGRA
jgi:hypothetical protein